MIPHKQHQHLETDEDPSLSRRAVLRRALLGIAGVGFASLLVACGGEDEDTQAGAGSGEYEPPDEPGVDPDERALPGTTRDEEEPADEADD